MLTNEELQSIKEVLKKGQSAEIANALTSHFTALEYAVKQTVKLAEKNLAAARELEEDFRKLGNELLMAAGVELTAREVGNEAKQVLSRPRQARPVRRRETYLKPPKTETRARQIEETKRLWREHMSHGAKRDEYGLLRGICKDVFQAWEGTDAPDYDGYPSYDALYNYCQTHQIWKEG